MRKNDLGKDGEKRQMDLRMSGVFGASLEYAGRPASGPSSRRASRLRVSTHYRRIM